MLVLLLLVFSLIDKGDGFCWLSTFSIDGVGHQLEGKLSCLAVALSAPSTFAYYHRPMEKAEHLKTFDRLEKFLAIGEGTKKLPKNLSDVINDFDMPPYLLQLCEIEDYSILFNNCWSVFYSPIFSQRFYRWFTKHRPAIAHRITSPTQTQIQEIEGFLSTPFENSFSFVRHQRYRKKGIGSFRFTRDRTNVVLHIRQGDAGSRRVNNNYYSSIISHVRSMTTMHSLPPPFFTIHSDSPVPDDLCHVEDSVCYFIDKKHQHPGSSGSELEIMIPQMILADLFVGSRSSLSAFAVLLREKPSIMPQGTRVVPTGLYSTPGSNDTEIVVKVALSRIQKPISFVNKKIAPFTLTCNSKHWFRSFQLNNFSLFEQ